MDRKIKVNSTENIAMNNTWSGSPFGVVRGFTYGHAGTKADIFMPELRQLGVGLVRLFLYWSQIEPKHGQYVWDAVDIFLDQLEPTDEAWIMVGTSSTWATRRSTDLLPSSPALDLNQYYQFVYALVSRCKGRVRYWQMDNEPHNQIFWAGTNQEYVEQLKVFNRAVRNADPDAKLILAGAAGISNPAFEPIPMKRAEREFFVYIMQEGADYYDVFDLHLYGDPYTIPTEINVLRQMMTSMGYEKPIFAGE